MPHTDRRPPSVSTSRIGTLAYALVRAYLPDDFGRVLAVRLPPSKRPSSGSDYWIMPGGKVLVRETPRQAVARKLREELGLDDRDPVELALTAWTKARYDDTHPRQTSLFRYASVPDPDMFLKRLVRDRNADEISEVAWLGPAEVSRLLHPLQVVQIRAVHQGRRDLEQTPLAPKQPASAVRSGRR